MQGECWEAGWVYSSCGLYAAVTSTPAIRFTGPKSSYNFSREHKASCIARASLACVGIINSGVVATGGLPLLGL